MKIYITGVAGFLGSHLATYYLSKGCEVAGIDNLIGGYEDNVPEGVDFCYGDLDRLEVVEEHVRGSDIVFHTACTAYEGLSVFSPSLVTRNTVQISVNAMVAAIKASVGRFVQCSSMARYGAQDVTPFTEDMSCKPQDPYGISKFSAELLLRNLASIHEIDLTIAVPHNIIGPRQKYDDPYRNVASIMINLMLQGRQPVVYGDGSQVRCFSDVDDDIGCLAQLAFSDKAVGETFNIGPDEEAVTILELATRIARIIGFDLDPVFLPDRPQEVKFATCSANKIRDYFGYETKITLDQSLERMIEYIDRRGVKPFKYHLPIEIINEKTPVTWRKKLF